MLVCAPTNVKIHTLAVYPQAGAAAHGGKHIGPIPSGKGRVRAAMLGRLRIGVHQYLLVVILVLLGVGGNFRTVGHGVLVSAVPVLRQVEVIDVCARAVHAVNGLKVAGRGEDGLPFLRRKNDVFESHGDVGGGRTAVFVCYAALADQRTGRLSRVSGRLIDLLISTLRILRNGGQGSGNIAANGIYQQRRGRAVHRQPVKEHLFHPEIGVRRHSGRAITHHLTADERAGAAIHRVYSPSQGDIRKRSGDTFVCGDHIRQNTALNAEHLSRPGQARHRIAKSQLLPAEVKGHPLLLRGIEGVIGHVDGLVGPGDVRDGRGKALPTHIVRQRPLHIVVHMPVDHIRRGCGYRAGLIIRRRLVQPSDVEIISCIAVLPGGDHAIPAAFFGNPADICVCLHRNQSAGGSNAHRRTGSNILAHEQVKPIIGCYIIKPRGGAVHNHKRIGAISHQNALRGIVGCKGRAIYREAAIYRQLAVQVVNKSAHRRIPAADRTLPGPIQHQLALLHRVADQAPGRGAGRRGHRRIYRLGTGHVYIDIVTAYQVAEAPAHMGVGRIHILGNRRADGIVCKSNFLIGFDRHTAHYASKINGLNAIAAPQVDRSISRASRDANNSIFLNTAQKSAHINTSLSSSLSKGNIYIRGTIFDSDRCMFCIPRQAAKEKAYRRIRVVLQISGHCNLLHSCPG